MRAWMIFVLAVSLVIAGICLATGLRLHEKFIASGLVFFMTAVGKAMHEDLHG